MLDVMEWFSAQGLEVGEKFAQGVRDLVDAASSGLSFLTELTGVSFHVNEQQIQNFSKHLVQLLTALSGAVQEAIAKGVDITALRRLGKLKPVFELILPLTSILIYSSNAVDYS